MEQAEIINRESYLRKMAIDGYILKLDLSVINELIRLLSNATNNLNQIARQVNETYHIYAQRPDATACADFDLWNKIMHRYVRRGSKGIALIDSTSDNPKLKYVFDVSDTGNRENSRRLYLWEMQEHHTEPILEMLNEKYNKEEINLYDAFYSIANNLATEYYSIYKSSLSNFIC